MSAARLEAFLALLYVDESARGRFLTNPRGEAANAGLSEQDGAALANIDFVGLELAAGSVARKRAALTTTKTNFFKTTRWLRLGSWRAAKTKILPQSFDGG
jgi:hypothetical protein